MYAIVKLILNPTAKTHITVKLYDNKANITIVMESVGDQKKVLELLSKVKLSGYEPMLCIKHWSATMRNDVLFQAKILNVLK